MHLYRSLERYHREYIKKGKCFIHLQDKNIFTVYLKGYGTTIHFITLVYSKHKQTNVIHTLTKYMDQYCECTKDISSLYTQKNFYREQQLHRLYVSTVSQCWIIFHHFYFPRKLFVYVNAIISCPSLYL